MKAHIVKLALLVSALVVSSPVGATKDSQLWTTESATLALSDHWRLQEELTERFSDNKNGLYEIESNTLLGYRMNKVSRCGRVILMTRNIRRATSPAWSTALENR